MDYCLFCSLDLETCTCESECDYEASIYTFDMYEHGKLVDRKPVIATSEEEGRKLLVDFYQERGRTIELDLIDIL